MATINLGNASPTDDIKQIDLKHPAIQIQPLTLDTPLLTPAATPEDVSPADDEPMAGKKLFSMERPDDKARNLAAKLTLEEQVRCVIVILKKHGSVGNEHSLHFYWLFLYWAVVCESFMSTQTHRFEALMLFVSLQQATPAFVRWNSAMQA